MRRSRFSKQQIIGILREQEAGMKTAEVCRKHGISDATVYKWKAKYGGLEVSEARRLKALEDENGNDSNQVPRSWLSLDEFGMTDLTTAAASGRS